MNEAAAPDIIDTEVHHKSIRNVANEMAVTLIRTSGSPVVTDAKDFSTAILDANAEQLAFAGHVTFHISTAVYGVQAVLRHNDVATIRPGDGFLCNDPHSSGAIHQGDIGIVMPFFAQGQLVGWGYVNEHVLDIGGSAVSGFAAGAFDRYAEALAFPATRVIREGRMEPAWEAFIANNVRMSNTVLNDIRSMVAANNVGARRIEAMIAEMGLDRFTRLNEAAKSLSERALRNIIRNLPDGTFESVDWVEYDGRGVQELHEVRVRLLVHGDEMTLQFRGGPQANSFINGARPSVIGQSWTTILAQLAYDIPINAGIWRPVHFDLGPEGTIVNAISPAPVSMSHIQTGMRINKLLVDVFSQACSLSGDAVLAGRVAGQPAQNQTYFTAFGIDRRSGQPSLSFPMSVGMSSGGPAQTVGDGMEVYAAQCMSGCDMPDVEIEEVSQPGMILWRRVAPDTGGAGVHRGGMGVSTAMAILHCDTMTGGAYTNTAYVPPRGSAGGYPGAAGDWRLWRHTNLLSLIDRHELIDANSLRGDVAEGGATDTSLMLGRGDVYTVTHGGGGGVGDPLRRNPPLVARDVAFGYVSAGAAHDIYGVVIAADGTLDAGATDARRKAVRTERIGGPPSGAVKRDAPLFAPLRIEGGRWLCTQCDESLCVAEQSWRAHAVVVETEVSELYARLYSQVRRAKNGRVLVREQYCPHCASSLSTDITLDGAGAVAQAQLGVQNRFAADLVC